MSGLWELVWGKPEVDPTRLAAALEREAQRPDLDYRTESLIRDSADALEDYWGPARWGEWLVRSAARERIQHIRRLEFDKVGFTGLRGALVERTEADTVRQYLRQVGTRLRSTVEVTIGGSASLILVERLSRATDDIDLVDEVPEPIRSQHRLLDDLFDEYRLRLTHFQSHFLPSGWKDRRHGLEPFGNLRAYLVDELDIVLSKLFSNRPKDLRDIRLLLPGIDRERLLERLRDTCGALLGEADLRANAGHNWYILTGQKLP